MPPSNLAFASKLLVTSSIFHTYLLQHRADLYVYSPRFSYYYLVCLSDSILAFHRYGMQGRSLRDGTVTQEITDQSRIYRLLGSDKYTEFLLLFVQY